MDIKKFIKQNKIILVLVTLIAAIVSAMFFKQLGKKDTAMFFAATYFLLIEIYLIWKDKRKSILLFIISFPILVTARKVCYFNFLFLIISYESIYVTVLFIKEIKNVWAYLTKIRKRNNKGITSLYVYITLFVIFAINSAFFSNSILNSQGEVFLSIIVPIMLMLVIVEVFTEYESLVKCLILSLDLSCFYGFMQILQNRLTISQIKLNRDLLTFGYHNINIFAGILVTIMPLILGELLYKKNTFKYKIFLYGSLLITLVALMVTFTRGAWICFILVALVLLYNSKYKYTVFAILAVGIVFIKKIITLIMSRGISQASILKNESVVARLQSIFTSFKIIENNPFGAGCGNFTAMYKKYAMAGYMSMPSYLRDNSIVADYYLEMAHNLWLQIAVDFGIICSLVFLVILINRIRKSCRKNIVNKGFLGSLLAYAFFSLSTGMEFNHKGVITGTLIIWIIFAMIEIENGRCALDEEAS